MSIDETNESPTKEFEIEDFILSNSSLPMSMVPDTGSREILQESTENRRNMEAVFRPEIFRIFPADFCQLPVLSGRNRAESIEKIPGRNTASTKSPELLKTGRFRAGLFDLGDISG